MRHISLILIVLFSLLAHSSCKKVQPRTHYVSAKIGSTIFYASGNFVTTHRAPTNPTLQVEGVMSNGSTIKLALNNYASKPQTFLLDGTNSNASYIPPTPGVETFAVH